MSRRKVAGLAGLARDTARGRQIVLSAGSIDGAFLAALQRLNLTPIGVTLGDQVSTWADGVTTANAQSQISEQGKKGGDNA